MSISRVQYSAIDSETGAHAVVNSDVSAILSGKGFTVANKMDIPTLKVGAISLTVPGAVASSLTFNMTAANADLTYTANVDGSAGNDITITHLQEVGNSRPLTVSVSANNQILVSLATSAVGVITSTAAQVKAAINAHPQASLLVTCEDEGAGAGIVNDMALANLAGGQDAINCRLGVAAFSSEAGTFYVSLLENYYFINGADFPPVNCSRVGTPEASDVTVSTLVDPALLTVAGQSSLDMLVLAGTPVAGQFRKVWDLAPGKTYVIAITNTNTTTATVGYDLFWTEEAY